MSSNFYKSLSNLSVKEFVNAFSIWVILGAPLSFLFFSGLFEVNVNLIDVICLTLAVWLIYTLDHIIDGYRKKDLSPILRHRLHYRYRKILIPLSVLALVALGILVFKYLDPQSYDFGLLISAVIILYYFLNKLVRQVSNKSLPFKELGIAAVVTACFAGIPFIHSSLALDINVWMIFLGFGLMNYANLLIFSYFDYDVDAKVGFSAISRYIGKGHLKTLIWFMLIVSSLIFIWLFTVDQVSTLFFATLLVMNIQLMFIIYFYSYFAKSNLYRFWGDLIYLYPGIYLFVN